MFWHEKAAGPLWVSCIAQDDRILDFGSHGDRLTIKQAVPVFL